MKRYIKWYILCIIFGAITAIVGVSIIEHPFKFLLVCIPFWAAPFVYPNQTIKASRGGLNEKNNRLFDSN